MKHFKQFFVFALLALFSVGAWGANYAKTAAASVVTGDVVIITYDNGTLYAMSNAVSSSNPPSAVSVTATNDVISTDATNILWDVTVADGSFTFKPHGDATNALYCTATNNGVRVGTNANNAFTVDATSKYLVNTATSRYVGCYNSQDFRCYTSINNNIKDQTPAFYVLQSGGSTKTLSSIAISGNPTKTAYYAGDEFDPAGLVVTGTYSDASTAPIASGITWSYDPSQTLALNQTSIGVTATVSEISSPKYNVTGLTVTEAVVSNWQVTAPADLETGDVVVLTMYQNSKYYAAANNNSTSSAPAATEVAVVNSKLSNVPGETLQWTVTVDENGYQFAVGDNKLYCTNTNNGVRVGTNENNVFTVAESESKYYLFNTATSRYLGVYNNQDWRCYTSVNTNINAGTLVIFREPASSKQAAGLAYDAADAQKLAKVGGTLTAPTLTNPNSLPIAYASSNTDVVEVNASTGAITAIKAAGKAVITASSEEDATYKAGSATYTIFVATEAGTAEDPLTEASAKALIDDGCTLNAHVAGTVLTPTYYSSSKTYTVTLTDGFQFYKLKDLGNELFTSDYLKANDQLVVLGPLGKHNTTYQLGDGCYIVNYVAYTEPLVDISNTKATAYTVAQALTLAANPTSDLSKAVYIAGVVYQVNSFNSTNGTYNIYIKDAGTSEDDGKFEFYKCSGLYEVGGTPAQFAEGDVQIGDEVIGYGVMTYYSGGNIWEFGQPNQLVSLNRPTVPVTSINLTESTATVEEGKTVTLHASVLPNNATDQDIVWTVVSGDTYASVDNGVVTGIAAGEAVIRAASHEEASIYAECTITVTEPAPLSPWATVYSSNVTVGAENYIIKILKPGSTTEYDEFEGMRYGTSGAAGVATITIPASTQALHFHAAAWNTENVTLEVKVGEETYPLTFGELVKEANIKGNGTTYELSTPIDEYYMLDLSSYTIADNTVITFTATGGNRFVLYGVNQEGGVLPVLESIEISGDLDNKTGYKVGDDLDLDGLTVSATYSLGGVAQTPVDITDKLGDGLTLTYDPLVEGQTEVTITATYEGETDDINITLDEAVASADPKIYVDKLNVNFGTVAKDAVVADQTITVTLTNVAAATAVLGGTNPEAFSIDKTALVDGDVITISVASTATYGSYSAKITISDNAAEAEAKIVNLSLAVEDVETPVSTISKWVAAEAADLVDGAEVLITGVKEAVTYAMGVQNNNNRAAVAASVDGEGVLTPGERTMAFTLVAQGDGTFALRTSNGKYLYAAASGSNHLKTQAEVDVNAKWTLTIASAVAEGSSNRNVMQFNSGSSLFSCYGTASQTDIALYTRAKEEREGFTVGKLATVCVPYAVAQEDIIGADVYEIAGKNEAGKIVFDQVVDMEAGVAYLVQAKAETATFYYSGNAVAEPQNEGKALKGTFAEIDIAAADAANVYFFKDNALWSAKETGVKILANRAWLDMSAVGNAGPSPAPGRRRITMDVHGENAATGMDELNASEAPRKMIIDGQLYILRGEKMYNANGTLVK